MINRRIYNYNYNNNNNRRERYHLESPVESGRPKLEGTTRPDPKRRHRPNGDTPVPWARGKYVAWDATTVHTCAASYIHLTSVAPGGAAEHAGDRKRAKYSNLPATHDFVPVAIESLDPVNRMTAISCDPRETAHLFQRLYICSQRFNAIASIRCGPGSLTLCPRITLI